MSLTPKREAFAVGLASGLTQAEAYRRAYPKAQKWADKTVWEHASRLAADGKVRARVEALTAKAAAANEITVERIVAELAAIAFGNKRDVMEWGPAGVKLRASDDLTAEQAAMVAEVQQTVSPGGGSLKLKTHDKVKALELLGRSLGMFKDSISLNGPIQVAATVMTPEQAQEATRSALGKLIGGG